MKNNNMKVIDLQNIINDRLVRFQGEFYNSSAEYHQWYLDEIRKVFIEHGITEMRPAMWRIFADTIDQDIKLNYIVADILTDTKKDENTPYDCGEIVSISVLFLKDFQNYTLHELRKILFEKTLQDEIKYLEDMRDDARETFEYAENEIAKLLSIKF